MRRVAPTPPEYVGTTTRSPESNSTSAFRGPGPVERATISTMRPRQRGSESFVPM